MTTSYVPSVIPPSKWLCRQITKDEPAGEPSYEEELLPRKRGGKAKLTEADIPNIRDLLTSGMLHRLIAERYGVSEKTIGHIRTGRRWWWIS